MYSLDNVYIYYTLTKGAKSLMGITIAIVIIMSIVLIYSFYFVTKMGYSRKWDEDE